MSQVDKCSTGSTCSGWRLECNNFASSLMSQNHTNWNLDFRFSLGTLFQESIIQLFVIDNEHKSEQHFLNKNTNVPACMLV